MSILVDRNREAVVQGTIGGTDGFCDRAAIALDTEMASEVKLVVARRGIDGWSA